jgi:formylglycine-generating enzyme required for sulfatase activity
VAHGTEHGTLTRRVPGATLDLTPFRTVDATWCDRCRTSRRRTESSPPSEENRFDDEVPHEVELTRGYWLGETPVTHRLWQAVMGSNRSTYPRAQVRLCNPQEKNNKSNYVHII